MKLIDILKEDYNKPTVEQLDKYWTIMIENQPEDVVKTLTGLVTGEVSFEAFKESTIEDTFDSFRDDLYNNED